MTNRSEAISARAPTANRGLTSSLPLERYGSWIVDHRRWVIGVVLAMTVLFGAFAAKQQVIINPASVVPGDHPYVVATNAIERIFGSKYLVVIGVTPKHGDALQPHVLETVQRLTDRLYAAPSVSSRTLLSLGSRQAKGIHSTADGFEARSLLATIPGTAGERRALQDAIIANPVYRQTVVSRDWRTATIMLELKQSPEGFGAMLADVRRIVDQEMAGAQGGAEMDIALGGNPVFLHQAEIFADRITWLFPLAVLVIGLLHFEAFRTWQGLILPLVTALLSVVWGVGVMGVMDVPLDIFNSPTPILILAVAAGHAVQLLKRYYERYIELVRVEHMEPVAANRLATIQSLAAVGPVLIIAGGVAMLGFFSLVVFEVPTVRAFGIFTGVGIMTAVILEFTFTPAVRASLRPPSLAQIDTETRVRFWDRLSAAIAAVVLDRRRRRIALAMLATLVLLAIAGWPRVTIDNASKSFFGASLPLQQDDALLNAQTGGTNALYVMVDTGSPDGVKDPEVLAAIRAVQREAQAFQFVGKTLSIGDFLERMHAAVTGIATTVEPLPDDRDLMAQYLLLYSMSGDPEDFSAHVDYDYQRAKISLMLRTNSNADVAGLVGHLQGFAAQRFPDHVKISFGGEVAQTLAVTEVMVRSKLLNIVQILLVIFAVSALAFRSLQAALLVLSPLLVVLALLFGAMGYFGVPLNIPNSLISAMAVGIGADYSIYLLYRIREYSAAGLSLPDAVEAAIKTAGKACLFVATAVAGGYAVLLLSFDYKVHMWLSSFIVLAMLASVFSALLLIPSVVLATRPRFITGKRSSDLAAILLIALAAVGFLLYSQVAWAGPPDAATLVERNAATARFPAATARAQFILENKGGSRRTRQAHLASKLQPNGEDTMRRVVFEAPADIRGTSTLLIEHSGGADDMWVYLPALKRVRRLAASNKRDSFAGTDFSYGDVMGYTVSDWQHTLTDEQQLDGVPHYVIESVPASADIGSETGYSKRTSWIRKDNLVASRIETLDTAGRPFKRFTFFDIQAVGATGRHWQPMRAVGLNLQTGHATTIVFSEFEVTSTLPDSLFAPNRLQAD